MKILFIQESYIYNIKVVLPFIKYVSVNFNVFLKNLCCQ